MYIVAYRQFLLKELQLQPLRWPFYKDVTLLITSALGDVSLMDVIEHACIHLRHCRLVSRRDIFGDNVLWRVVSAPLFCPKRNGQSPCYKLPGRDLLVPRGLFRWDYGNGLPKPRWMIRRDRNIEEYKAGWYTVSQLNRKSTGNYCTQFTAYVFIIISLFIAFIICRLF